MKLVARAAVIVFCASAFAGVAGAAGDAPKPVPVAEPTSKADARPVRSDRLEREVVERETQRRSNSKAKAPVMPAERS